MTTHSRLAASRPTLTELQHASSAAMAAALGRHAVWFAATDPVEVDRLHSLLPEALVGRLTHHRHAALACLTVDALAPADLLPLHQGLGLRNAFLNSAHLINAAFANGDQAQQLARAGFKLFVRHGAEASSRSNGLRHAAIGSAEYLVSQAERLQNYPTMGQSALRSQAMAGSGRRIRAVVLLDLVQDFEVLRPLLALAAAPGGPFDLCVAVTDRVQKSPIWAVVNAFLTTYGVKWFTPLGAPDMNNALGSAKALLLTASESTAPAHVFGHTAASAAPARTLRVTLQHGLECVGLRHHRAHDIDFPDGVRFSSDIVLTWDHPLNLPDLHPAELHKCVAVGVVKAIAERGAGFAEQRWLSLDAPRLSASTAAQKQPLLIAENLHSVRFRSPARYQRFLGFVREAQYAANSQVTIRSHPASRILERQATANGMKFLDGMLCIEDLLPFVGFVSPPSTVLLDAVTAGVPSAVWSDAAAAGDSNNYSGLPVVADFSDWLALAGSDNLEVTAQQAWAARSTTAMNGVPAAWNTLVHLFN